jgi:hypothetical protein
MEQATPDGIPNQLDSWADAVFSSVVSPPPPAKAPLRKSMTKGQLENTIGKPGKMTLTITRLANVSAKDCARKPAFVAGPLQVEGRYCPPTWPAGAGVTAGGAARCASRYFRPDRRDFSGVSDMKFTW